MRTVCCLSCVCLGVSALEGGLPRGRGFARGVVCPWGVCMGVYTPSPVDRMTDACENITFPQLLLRTVIKIGMVLSTYRFSHSSTRRRIHTHMLHTFPRSHNYHCVGWNNGKCYIHMVILLSNITLNKYTI